MTEHDVAPKLTLLPAIDVAGGLAVRLARGAMATDVRPGDPFEIATDWVREGAEWIHLVDLDAAFGRGHNRATIASIVERKPRAVSIELSGGICDEVALQAALAAGAERVIIGTAALANLDWVMRSIEAHGDAIAVGLDVRGSTLAPRGSTQDVGDLWRTLDRLEGAGCSRYVVADVARDGTLEGPNLEMLALVCSRTGVPIIASGGIATLDDIVELRALVPHGLEGAIVGMALYSGGFTLAAALRIANGPPSGSRDTLCE